MYIDMGVIVYGWVKYIPKKVTPIELSYEDYVCIDGVCGYVDFPGSEDILIVDESKKLHHFKVAEINNLLRLKKRSKTYIELIDEQS